MAEREKAKNEVEGRGSIGGRVYLWITLWITGAKFAKIKLWIFNALIPYRLMPLAHRQQEAIFGSTRKLLARSLTSRSTPRVPQHFIFQTLLTEARFLY